MPHTCDTASIPLPPARRLRPANQGQAFVDQSRARATARYREYRAVQHAHIKVGITAPHFSLVPLTRQETEGGEALEIGSLIHLGVAWRLVREWIPHRAM
jgi:hypothetical protein